MSQYKDAVEVINSMASVKMTMNNHKGQIEDVPPLTLVALMRKEVDELEEALGSGNMVHIIEEAADIQNFLLGLVQQQINEYRGRKNANAT